ncbi:MAG: hypothetical protein ACR2GH_16835 [Pseudonocardia sp.]
MTRGLTPAFVDSSWQSVTNHLIAWDLPAPPGYRSAKAALFLVVEPRWEPFFADVDADIDWRLVSWGGVLIDDRPLADRKPCARLHPGAGRPAADRCRRGELVPRRADRVRRGGQRRCRGLPAQHHGDPRDGGPVAFDAATARAALGEGRSVAAAGVEVFADGDGLRARVPGGAELAAHEAFWFAWSQFHPDTVRWPFP